MSNDLIEKINKIKVDRNAIILAHYYQPPEIQDLADYVGDSYFLSEIARDCDEEVIVFCGVKFMGESAKILSPNKKVLMPIIDAGCAMADMANEKVILELKKKYPNAIVVCYINSTAEVKSHCDVAVTSSSAVKILNNIHEKQVIFVPDKNLGKYISEEFPEKEFILWDGYCKYHHNIKVSDIIELRIRYKNAKVLVHPECQSEIRDIADYIGSTSGIIDYATKSNYKDFIVATEEGILHELTKKNPNKNFYIPGDSVCCEDMKKTTLESIYETLLKMENEIYIEEEIRVNALNCLLNMHRFAGDKNESTV
ncbi:quinolinate synthase NadA [Romboutsia sp. Marseille-P6047]|uniref:quinolinate synthase NadA n=1 Tax=Romboutsia sp. Marseille-P6047 TaxID=2161817 RepID=UPI000F051A75|nr:quinolinate synthase NadA [Romboutsia sp. Marseille-P6047]